MAANAETIRSSVDAFARKDLDGVLAGFDERIEWHVPDVLPHGGSYNGHDGVQQFVQTLFEHWEEFRVDADEHLDAGDKVVTVGRFRARARRTGAETEAPMALVWTMRDGKAVRMEEISDTESLLRALSG